MAMLIITAIFLLAIWKMIRHSDFYYNGEEGYELECERDEYKDHAE